MIQLVKRFLKSGVQIFGVVTDTEEGSPQGGPLSPLLAFVFLNEFDFRVTRRGVRYVRYADDIVLFAKSRRAAERLLENGIDYLEGKLKLKVNREKSKIDTLGYFGNGSDFKFLGFSLTKGKNGFYIIAHRKSLKKFRDNLKRLSSRKAVQSLGPALYEIQRYAQGWLNYFRIASMKTRMEEINGWLRRRIRARIWDRWKRVRTKMRNLLKLGIIKDQAYMAANCSRGNRFVSQLPEVSAALNNKRLANSGYFDISAAYQRLHENC